MKRINLLFCAVVSVLLFAACDTNENGGDGITPPNERITFTLNNLAPTIAAPDEDISYKFTISYTNGLASVATWLNGEVIEGSEQSWEDAPTEVDYTFNYTVKGAQFGETLDFVFTATGTDGYTQSVDYALWVTANAVEFTISVPEGQPSEIYSDATINFNAKVECGNILKSIEVFKNGEAYASKNDFTDEKTYEYPFTYTPATEDIGTTVEFHFVVTDVKGNTAETYYSVAIIKADLVGKMLWSENFNTTMAISNTSAHDTTEGGITGGSATQFTPSNIVKYNTFYTSNPDDPEGEPVENVGAMEGCEVYDDDLSAIVYTTDGVDVCLSKYGPNNESKNMDGAYLWYRKAKKGWFRVDGIKLHGATSLKLTYSQSAQKAKVEYSIDGETWVEIGATEGAAETNEFKFSIPAGNENISLKFSENDGTGHVRLDNLKLVEVL